MESSIESKVETWKKYSSGHRRFILRRSCIYDPSPGKPRPPGENLPPRITVRISVRELKSGIPERIGEIKIHVNRPRWNHMAGLNNEAEASKQLERASISVRDRRDWEIEPLPTMLNKGFEEIQKKIAGGDSTISGEFLLSLDGLRLIPYTD